MILHPTALIASVLFAAASAGLASAQTPPPGGAPGGGMGGGMGGFPRTAEEVQPWAERLFSRFDTNQDGAITEDELAVLDSPNAAPMGGSRFRTMILAADANSDARVSSAEWTSAAQQMFERMSGAGRPGGGPPGAAPPGAAPPGAGRPGGGPGAGGMGGGGAEMFSPPRAADAVAPWAERLFTRLDANQDASITGNELAILANPMVASMGGSRLRAMIAQSDSSRDSRISLEEMTAGAQRMFNRMDTNGDGRLSDAELPRPAAPAPPASVNIPPADSNPFPDMPNGD
jgi:Ca2+-binding EF-hand superfamily protein